MIGRHMTRRERVVAALRGEPVDRVPVSLWLHNFATENSAETLAAETVRLARRFDWDFLKPQSRAQCFAEMWGLRYAPSNERATQYTVTHAPLATAADLRPTPRLRGECALRRIRRLSGDGVQLGHGGQQPVADRNPSTHRPRRGRRAARQARDREPAAEGNRGPRPPRDRRDGWPLSA